MPKAYSADMRERVIAEVEGGASRREAAEEVEVSASTAIIWVKCFRETGRCAAKPRGGSVSPLEEYADFLLGLIKKEPDLTLDDVALAMRKHKIPGGRAVVGRGWDVNDCAGAPVVSNVGLVREGWDVRCDIDLHMRGARID